MWSLPLLCCICRAHLDYGPATSSRQVDSWFADHNFDYIDACCAEQTGQSRRSQSFIRSGLNPYVRRDVIAFGAPTPRDVAFNVSGQYYRVNPDLLAKFPDTLLGNREKRAKFWDASRKEYFLDKHRATFEVIINYYVRNGELNRPDDIPIDIFINEIKFYCLDRENLLKFLSAEGILLVEKEKEMPDTEVKKYIWNLFEDPESCKVARVVTTMSAMVIAISIVVFCMETVPRYESLGKESLKHISPALITCHLHLCNEGQYYEPNGTLFSAVGTNDSDDNHRCDYDNMDVHSSLTPSSDERSRHVRSAYPTPTAIKSTNALGAGIQFDDFDGSVLLHTMTETLTICSQNAGFSVLSKYTYLRCKSELGYFAENPLTLLETLGELEFHESHESHDAGPSTPQKASAVNDVTTPSYGRSPIVKEGRLDSSRKQGSNTTLTAHSQVNSNGKHHRQSDITTIFYQRAIKPAKHHKTDGNGTNTTEKGHRSRKSHRTGHKRSTHPESADNLPRKKKQKLLTLKQTIRGLIQLCHKLDNRSIRSSYHWLALEATIGGAAGMAFLLVCWINHSVFLYILLSRPAISNWIRLHRLVRSRNMLESLLLPKQTEILYCK